MAQINKPSAPLVPPTTDADVENIVNEAIATDDTHASLVNGEVPSDQLPSYVDDVLEFDDVDEFPAEGETGKIYVALDTNYTYRWSGAAYVQVGGASLGEGNGIEIENDLVSVKFAEVESGLEFNGNNELVVDFNTVADHVAGSGGGSFIYSTESHYLDVRVDQIQATLQNDENFQTWVDERADAVAATAAPTYFGDSGSLAFGYLFNGVDESLNVEEENDTLHMGVNTSWLDTQIHNTVPTYGPGIAADSDGSGQYFWYVDTGYLNENLEFQEPIDDLADIRSGAAAGATAKTATDNLTNNGDRTSYYIKHYNYAEFTAEDNAAILQVFQDFKNGKHPRLYCITDYVQYGNSGTSIECILQYGGDYNGLHVLIPMLTMSSNKVTSIRYCTLKVRSNSVTQGDPSNVVLLGKYVNHDISWNQWDETPVQNSTKAVISGGIYDALAAKADASAVYTKSEVDSAIAAAIGDVLDQSF